MSPSSPVIKVISAGIYAALQDAGRYGHRHLGVPVSGAMDTQSLYYVNHVLQNNINSPAIEILGHGAKFEILEEVRLCVSGASGIIHLYGKNTTPHQPFFAKKGQILYIQKIITGARFYLGISGGFFAEPVMQSVSTINGTHLGPLKKNEVLRRNIDEIRGNSQNSRLIHHTIDKTKPIQALHGPEYHFLSETSAANLMNATYTITNENNRMGYRLSGPALYTVVAHNNLLTSAVLPGTVQLLPGGQLILLMRECQTTGGYPRVLQVEEASINQLAQRWASDSIRFLI